MPEAGRSLEQWVVALRAAMPPEHVERLRADAELAVAQLAPGSFRSAALYLLEIAELLDGDGGPPDGIAAQVNRSDQESLEMVRFRMRCAASLTGAELRLLPLLATHLSLRGIGERLHISRNTVKSEAISAYRKLGVSSRSEAVERAAELGLIEATAATSAGDLSRRPAVPKGQVSQLNPSGSSPYLQAASHPGSRRASDVSAARDETVA